MFSGLRALPCGDQTVRNRCGIAGKVERDCVPGGRDSFRVPGLGFSFQVHSRTVAALGDSGVFLLFLFSY